MPGDRTTPRDEHGNSSPRPQSALLDIGQPKRWRRLVPRGLRSLFWSDSARRYDAFLSYSRKSDSSVAPVIQSALQRFLRPWYKVRAKTIFQHLSCLPAGSNLEAELFDRLDRSHHLILLASPDAARSQGMQAEASHWFSRQRDGHELGIVTKGSDQSWHYIRDHLLPPAIRTNLTYGYDGQTAFCSAIVWDIGTGKELFSLTSRSGPIPMEVITWSSDGKRLIV